ncbi:MAG: SpoIID/LytB domain-containing protein [Proteobacteria bacterium]|nr:SpoIID/LytB domain-containing protein [Pseudomonadota bacterium]
MWGHERAWIGLLTGLLLWFGTGDAAADEEVRVRHSDGRVVAVPLDPYVERSVEAEVYASWPDETLKAQAVISRTYALYERGRNAASPHDVEASVLSQVYAESEVSSRVRSASRATRGQYLSYEGAPILAAFHASSGGRTASAEEVWGLNLPYLRMVASPDDAAPDYFWSYEIELADLLDALREAGYAAAAERGEPVRIESRSESGRVAWIEIGEVRLSGHELRQVLGGRARRSARFEVRRSGTGVRFLGSGAGHGVGLCQWGARELALQGRTYAEILAHYYPGTRLARLDGTAPAEERGAETTGRGPRP